MPIGRVDFSRGRLDTLRGPRIVSGDESGGRRRLSTYDPLTRRKSQLPAGWGQAIYLLGRQAPFPPPHRAAASGLNQEVAAKWTPCKRKNTVVCLLRST